jgi:hypothetical protein
MSEENLENYTDEQLEALARAQDDNPDGWDSFTGQFTWQNIGVQVANGILSGGASWALGSLLSAMKKKDTNLEELLQRFADNIVARVTSNVRRLIYENTWRENMRDLKVSAKSLTKKYRSYEATGDRFWLNATLEHSVEALEEAYDLGTNALGLFTTIAGIKMLAYRKAADDNNNQGYLREIVVELPEYIAHIERLTGIVESRFRETVGHAYNITLRDELRNRIILEGYKVYVDGNVYEFWKAGNSANMTGEEARERAFIKAFAPTKKDVIDPALKVKDKWKDLLSKLCELHPDLCQ